MKKSRDELKTVIARTIGSFIADFWSLSQLFDAGFSCKLGLADFERKNEDRWVEGTRRSSYHSFFL